MADIEKIAIIAFGDGGELGSFEVFAKSLNKELSGKYKKIIVQYVNRDTKFFDLIESIDPAKYQIAELHVFSHAIGAGLFIGYKDPSVEARRKAIYMSKQKISQRVTYQEAVRTEIGAVQTDDLQIGSFKDKQKIYQKRFSNSAFIKLWGCNSGVRGWIYSDGGVVDPNDTSVPYYWRAFNEKNKPKQSIAQAMATFFNKKVYGSNSGASIEVLHNQKWKSSQQYKNQLGHWPSGALPHRLVPDQGTYNVYLP